MEGRVGKFFFYLTKVKVFLGFLRIRPIFPRILKNRFENAKKTINLLQRVEKKNKNFKKHGGILCSTEKKALKSQKIGFRATFLLSI